MKTGKMLMAALGLLPMLGFAQSSAPPLPTAPVIDQRQANQAQRIENGVSSGELNSREARRLQRGQQRVQARENYAMSDGVVSLDERSNLRQAERRQSRRVYRQAHDGRP